MHRCGSRVPMGEITSLWGINFEMRFSEISGDFEVSLNRMDVWTSFGSPGYRKMRKISSISARIFDFSDKFASVMFKCRKTPVLWNQILKLPPLKSRDFRNHLPPLSQTIFASLLSWIRNDPLWNFVSFQLDRMDFWTLFWVLSQEIRENLASFSMIYSEKCISSLFNSAIEPFRMYKIFEISSNLFRISWIYIFSKCLLPLYATVQSDAYYLNISWTKCSC